MTSLPGLDFDLGEDIDALRDAVRNFCLLYTSDAADE